MDSEPQHGSARNDEKHKSTRYSKIEIAPDGKPVQYGDQS